MANAAPRPLLTAHHALIWLFVLVSASDGDMSDAELHEIGELAKTLPVFRGFEAESLPVVARECAAILGEPNGFGDVIGMVREALPKPLRETAYALALDVAYADRPLTAEELRVLERVRETLELDRLIAAAIERTQAARYRVA